VLTGGRGKAGGVKLADDPADAEAKAHDILGLEINGHVVRKLWIERASDIAKEYYLSITFDRGAKQPLYMLTTEGGVEIEQVAEEKPDALARLHVDPLEGFPAIPGAAPHLRRRHRRSRVSRSSCSRSSRSSTAASSSPDAMLRRSTR
jgi:succinyl-CoA synthetase beta subunit